MAVTIEELKELVLLSRETGDEALELKALEKMVSMTNQQAEVAEQPIQQEPQQIQPVQEDGFFKNVADVGLEAISGFNKGLAGVVDFIPDTINAGLELGGIESRMPTLRGLGVGEGGFMEPGLARDVVQAGGQAASTGLVTGGALRTAANRIAPEVQTVGANIMRQLGTGKAGTDVALGAASGAGAVVGQEKGGETGALIGAVLAPVAGAGAGAGLKKLIGAGGKGISTLIQSTANMSDDGAATLLAEAMVREGLSPDDVAKQMAKLGPEALPADVGNNFARLLRTASNKIPRIEGQAATVFKARHSGQGDRLLSALDDATGTASLTLDDEIARINAVMKPKINALYAEAGEKGIRISPKLAKMLQGKGSLGKARQKAELRLVDKREMGEAITNIDVIDSTKKELGDKIGKAIRNGEMERARDLVRVKNFMVSEADESIPAYAKARSMYAGKAELENAADAGTMFLKMKPRDMQDLTKSMGESEKRMFKLGAKQSILDKIDDLSLSADGVKRLFGKNGDTKKLGYLFDDAKSYKQFNDTLEQEANFVLTRRAAQANSTTAKQLSDEMNAVQVLQTTFDTIQNPVGAVNKLGQILGGLKANKSDAAFTKALEDVGDILLTKGMNAEKIQALLRKGSAIQIETALKRAMKKELSSPRVAPITSGAALGVQRAPEENRQ